MRSESCSFIWQPNVVTWKRFTAVGGYRGLLCIEGRVGGGEISRGAAKSRYARLNNPTRPAARRARRAAARRRQPRRSSTRLGFDRDAIRATRSRAGGCTGSIAASTPSATRSSPRDGRYLAAVMACGDGAALSHRSAAALWGIRPSAAARFDVTVPRTSGVRSSSRSSCTGHETRVETTRRRDPGHHARPHPADLATALPRRPLEKAVEQAEVRKLHVAIPPNHPGAQRVTEAADQSPARDDRQPARGRVPRAVRRLRHPAAARAADRRGLPGRLLLARGAPDRRDRRLRAPRHARRVRARSREGRSADGPRLARAAVHRAAGAP